MSITDDFLAKVEAPSQAACWTWLAYRDWRGYGRAWSRESRKVVLAHRLAYELFKGTIPAGLVVDHTCFNPICVNPHHLRVLTRSENASQKRCAFKPTCINGHEYTPENTYTRPNVGRGGQRDCRACIRDRVRRYKARGRAA